MNTSLDLDLDFAKMLQDSIDDKINQSREEMQEYHNPIFNQSLSIEIQALEWVPITNRGFSKWKSKKR